MLASRTLDEEIKNSSNEKSYEKRMKLTLGT